MAFGFTHVRVSTQWFGSCCASSSVATTVDSVGTVPHHKSPSSQSFPRRPRWSLRRHQLKLKTQVAFNSFKRDVSLVFVVGFIGDEVFQQSSSLKLQLEILWVDQTQTRITTDVDRNARYEVNQLAFHLTDRGIPVRGLGCPAIDKAREMVDITHVQLEPASG